MVARTERSPGSGRPLAFPVSQWRHERVTMPDTVAGPRRTFTGFRVSPFASNCASSLPGPTLLCKGTNHTSLELSSLALVPFPFVRRYLALPTVIARVELR